MSEKEPTLAGHDARIINLEKTDTELKTEDKDIWKAINSLRNRPPVWMMFLVSCLTGFSASCVTYIVAV